MLKYDPKVLEIDEKVTMIFSFTGRSEREKRTVRGVFDETHQGWEWLDVQRMVEHYWMVQLNIKSMNQSPTQKEEENVKGINTDKKESWVINNWAAI